MIAGRCTHTGHGQIRVDAECDLTDCGIEIVLVDDKARLHERPQRLGLGWYKLSIDARGRPVFALGPGNFWWVDLERLDAGRLFDPTTTYAARFSSRGRFVFGEAQGYRRECAVGVLLVLIASEGSWSDATVYVDELMKPATTCTWPYEP